MRFMGPKVRITPTSMRILHSILAQGNVRPTHKDIAYIASAGERTVSKAISDFKANRLVTGGHPADLGPGLGLVLGVSVGSEKLRAGIVDASGHLYHQIEEPPLRDQLNSSPQVVLGRIRRLAVAVLTEALSDERLRSSNSSLPLLGIAVAWPCPID